MEEEREMSPRALRRFQPKRVAMAIVALLIAVACVAGPASASRFGLKGGYLASGFLWAGDYWPGYERGMRDGYSVTAFGEWFDYRGASMRVGIAYNQRGGTLEGTGMNLADPSGRYTDDLRIDYAMLSVALRLRHETRFAIPYACIGPFADFPFHHEQLCESGSSERPCWVVPMAFPDESYRSVVFGFAAGVGAEFPMKDLGALFLELSYERGLSRAIVCEPALCGVEMKGGYESFCVSGGIVF